MIEVASWCGAGLLLAISLWLSIANAWCIFGGLWCPNERRPSWIPILGGLLGCLAYWVAPMGDLRPWCWMPFVYDAGSLFGMSWTAYFYLCVLPRTNPRDRS